jgi:hypothetical protein
MRVPGQNLRSDREFPPARRPFLFSTGFYRPQSQEWSLLLQLSEIGVRRLLLAVGCVGCLGLAHGPIGQAVFSRASLDARLPIVREQHYAVNARIRPLLFFWIGRDDIGSARITWREGTAGHRALELVVGSDPARAPRHINRWGFIVEEQRAGTTEVLGLMKESGEATLEEAAANVDRSGGDTTTFKAVRTTVNGGRGATGTLSFQGAPNTTYNELDALLEHIPSTFGEYQSVELPAGAEVGFLAAMTSLVRNSAEPCRRHARDAGARVRPIQYLYHQTIFDLSLTSCEFEPTLRTKRGTFSEIVDGRFQVRNRQTGEITKFQVAFGTSGRLLDLPVRAVFRPRWWLEVELLLG